MHFIKKDSSLPKRCKRLRELRGDKTQREMSVLLDVTEKTYRSWEKGEYRKGRTKKTYPQPDLERLIKMSEVFHCSIDYLLCRSDCTSVDNHYISLKTGLSEKAINELHYLAVLDNALATEPDLNIINTLLEQLSSPHNNIIHTITDYLRSNGLSKDIWYNIRNETLSENKPPMDTDRLHIPAHSDIFDNLLLMDIQKRIINLKTELKKAPDTD